MSGLQNIKETISAMSPAEAIAWLTQHIDANPADDEALYQRGKLHWKAGEKRLALNDYNAAVALNPGSPARLAIESANSILNFYNKDLYNP